MSILDIEKAAQAALKAQCDEIDPKNLEQKDPKSHISIQSFTDRRIGPLLTDILFDLQRQKTKGNSAVLASPQAEMAFVAWKLRQSEQKE